MPDYANAKIYKIVGKDGSTYYGSTTVPLKKRMNGHAKVNCTTAYRKIISQMEWTYEMVESYPCTSRKELEAREGWYIRNNLCVNLCTPGRTRKEYYEDNMEDIKATQQKYREAHLEDKRIYNRKLYLKNREQRRTLQKSYQTWFRSFGDPRTSNCLHRSDPSLFT
jgi:hypothetical protein